MFKLLKPKDEKKVYIGLQQICIDQDWPELYHIIQNGLDQIGFSDLKMTPYEYPESYKIECKLLLYDLLRPHDELY